MKRDMPTTRARVSEPSIGAWVPTATLHLVFLTVAAGLCLLVLDAHFWLVVGLLITVAATLVPNVVSAWWLLLLLGSSQIWRAPSATDIVFYLLLAGVHLLHVLSSFTRLLPWNGRIQLIALVRPLQRFVLVQAVSQVVAVGALLTFGGGRGTISGLSMLAAAMLGIVALALVRGVRRA